jgi:hypothetical protein
MQFYITLNFTLFYVGSGILHCLMLFASNRFKHDCLETSTKIAFGRSVWFRKGFGILIFPVFDVEFEGQSPS